MHSLIQFSQELCEVGDVMSSTFQLRGQELAQGWRSSKGQSQDSSPDSQQRTAQVRTEMTLSFRFSRGIPSPHTLWQVVGSQQMTFL